MRESISYFPQICPTQDKRCFPSQAKARRAAIRASVSRKVKLSHYHCRCGAWHLTRREQS